jgi:hypothetical protein
MPISRNALMQLVGWFPIGQPLHRNVQWWCNHSTAAIEPEQTRIPTSHRGPINDAITRTLMPDMRHCEPWRHSILLDAARQLDPSAINRLTR